MPLEDQEDRFNDCFFIDKTHLMVATSKNFFVISTDFKDKQWIQKVIEIHKGIDDVTCCSLDHTETGFLISCRIQEDDEDEDSQEV